MAKASKRQLQTAETIKRHFASVLFQEGSYIYGSEALVTVSSVVMSADMGIAKVYVSVYNSESKEAVLALLETNLTRLRQLLSQRVKKHLRRVPYISIFLDETLDEMYRVDELLSGIKSNSPESEDEEE